jgi:gluconokinase
VAVRLRAVTQVVALDLGSSSLRARVFDDRAEPVGPEEQHAYDSTAGTLDPDELVAAASAALAAVGDADAVGCSAFWHSLLALDARGRPLTPVLTWRDVRSAAHAERLRCELDTSSVHARTGCVLHPSYWPAKLAWLREADPDAFRAARRFVGLPEYLLLRLTGELRMSLSQASGTGLWGLDAWDDELLETLGVERHQLPPVSDEPIDGWYPPLGDGACSNVGAGCVTPDRAALMIGTSAAVRVVRSAADARPRPGLFRYRLDAERVVEGGSLSDGGNLYAWLESTLRLPAEVRVAERDADSHGLTFLPLLGGERSPGWHPSATGAVVGLRLETTPLDLLQAALEGVAYRVADLVQLLPEVRELVATGAALERNPAWGQILADAIGRPVLRGVGEGSARGAAVIALERLGILTPPAPLRGGFDPRPERVDAHRAARERQRLLYETLT